MKVRLAAILGLLLSPAGAWCQQLVRFQTNLGNIDVVLLPNAPQTVQNFLNYMNKGAYDNSVIHRSVPGFVIQGGGYQLQNHTLVQIPADAAVPNEAAYSNVQGTIAMALTGTDVNSATSQWYFNEVDNSATLDPQSFTVFGRINDSASLAVMLKIATVPVPSPAPLASPFNTIPLLNYGSGAVQDSNYVLVQTVRALVAFPAIKSQGVVTATSFGGYPAAASGSFIEIYGSNLALTTRGWASSDFNNGSAPTTLDGVSVTIGGISAYVNYVSPSQVNVQVPAGVPTSGTAPVVVSYSGQASAAVTLSMRPYEGALLAPASFNVGGKQYVAAVHSGAGTYVTNGKVAGLPNAPAAPGETVIFYGIGFGPVSPSTTPVAGKVVTEATTLNNALSFQIGTSTAQVAYAGLVQGLVGVYQFNVVVPLNTPNGDAPVTVTLGQQTVPQTLYLPVQSQ